MLTFFLFISIYLSPDFVILTPMARTHYRRVKIKNKMEYVWDPTGKLSLISSYLYNMGRKKTKSEVVNLANLVHENKYTYSKLEYVNSLLKVCIICPIHGDFYQAPHDHLRGFGCHECGKIKCIKTRTKTINKFIEEAVLLHGDKFDYSKVKYKNTNTKVNIICPKHGVFEQRPKSHLKGHGCSKCSTSKGEEKIGKILDEFGIIYKKQATFDGCVYKQKLRFDFYLPEFNLCVEYDGKQHYVYTDNNHWGGEAYYNVRKIRDKIKDDFCLLSSSPNLLRIPYWEFKRINEILKRVVNG